MINYFDNASTTYPKADIVYRESMRIYEEIGVNFSRNKSEKSVQAKDIKDTLIKNIKEIASTTGEVILNSSSTLSLNEIILGLDYSNIKTVYISPFEHNAVYRAVVEAQKRYEFDLEIIKFDRYELDESDLELKFLSKKPDLVICLHASNVFGNILPIEKIFTMVKERGGITVLDASQTMGLLDMSKISNLCDFITFAGHKTLYGPSGIGGYLYNNRDIKLKPLLFGGTGIKSEEIDMPEDMPERYEAGSPNILGMIGLYLSTRWILEIGMEKIRAKEEENYERLKEILCEYEDELEIYLPEKSVGIISITSEDHTPQELGNVLEADDIYVRTGMHCSPLAHKHMGTEENGAVRFSVSYFNRNEEFERLEEVLEEIL
jgi:selenocysteine lyase/cysteine desulfurase